MMLGFFYHAAVGIFIKERTEIGSAVARRVLCRRAVLDELRHIFQGKLRTVVFRFQMRQVDVYNENDFLTEIIKSNDLVKKHQIHIPEPFRILRIQMQGRLGIF